MTDTPLQATITQRGVIVTPDEYVLTVKQASDGGWELPGGRLDRNEGVIAGVEREIREETALEPAVIEPVHTVAWVNDEGAGRFGTYYYCRGPRREVSLSAEHVDADWRARSAIGSRLSEPQTVAVEAALERHRELGG